MTKEKPIKTGKFPFYFHLDKKTKLKKGFLKVEVKREGIKTLKRNCQYNYDAKYDILYISKIPNEPCIGTEEIDGVVIRHSAKDNKFVGVTIFNIKQMIS